MATSTLPLGLDPYYQFEDANLVPNAVNPGSFDLTRIGGNPAAVVTGNVGLATDMAFMNNATFFGRPAAPNWVVPLGVGLNHFSCAVWFKVKTFVTPGFGFDRQIAIMEGNGSTDGTTMWQMGVFAATQLIFVQSSQSDQTVRRLIGPVINVDEWNFLVLVVDGTAQTLTMYHGDEFGAAPTFSQTFHDGSLVDTGAVAGFVARLTNFVTGDLFGIVDEVLIWAQRAITADEVVELFNGGSGVEDVHTLPVPEDPVAPGAGSQNPAEPIIVTLPNGLCNWYQMDVTPPPIVNQVNPGTQDLSLSGVAPLLETGILGSSLRFSDGGSSQFVFRTPSNPRWVLAGGPGTVSFTIAQWVNPDSLLGGLSGSDSSFIIEGNGSSPATFHFYLGYDKEGDRFQFITNQQDNTTFTVDADEFGAVSVAGWHLLIGWVDAAVGEVGISVNLYENIVGGHDGSLQSIGSVEGFIGRLTIFNGGQSHARIDDTLIWCDRALSAGERVGLFNSGFGQLDILNPTLIVPPGAAGGRSVFIRRRRRSI